MIGRMHHVVVDCTDPDALAAFMALGAVRLGGDHVYDPAGHPFCLIRRPRWAAPIPEDG